MYKKKLRKRKSWWLNVSNAAWYVMYWHFSVKIILRSDANIVLNVTCNIM